MRIEYIFNRFLLRRRKVLNKKLSFNFLKKKYLFKNEEKTFRIDFLFFLNALVICPNF